jgi:2-(1,2-epoxy-1,2-dihydrophenyl)acetyl-CoA isomerase
VSDAPSPASATTAPTAEATRDDFVHLRTSTSAEGVRTITLDRPDRLNAVNARLADELPLALQQAAADDAVRAVVITGAGRGFCAGLDLGEPVSLARGSRAERIDPLYWVGRWVFALTACEKPVVAAVNGAAAGAGFGLALACDLRVIARRAKLTAGYVRRGLSPDAGVSWFLPRLVGHGRAADIMLTGRDISAEEAERIGLATQVVDDEQVRTAALALATQLAAGPPIALALTKRLLVESAQTTLEAQLRSELAHIKSCFMSADVREAMAAFQEKRAPVFRGA